MAFKLRSGNKTNFKQMGTSPMTKKWRDKKHMLQTTGYGPSDVSHRELDPDQFDWDGDGELKGEELEGYNDHKKSLEVTSWQRLKKDRMENSKSGGDGSQVLTTSDIRRNNNAGWEKVGSHQGPDGKWYRVDLDRDGNIKGFKDGGSKKYFTEDQRSYRRHFLEHGDNWKQAEVDRRKVYADENEAKHKKVMEDPRQFQYLTQAQKDSYETKYGLKMIGPGQFERTGDGTLNKAAVTSNEAKSNLQNQQEQHQLKLDEEKKNANVTTSTTTSKSDANTSITPSTKVIVDEKAKSTGKSWDEAYKTRDKDTYGKMDKADYIKEAKRQKTQFKADHGKDADYKDKTKSWDVKKDYTKKEKKED